MLKVLLRDYFCVDVYIQKSVLFW